MEKRSWPWKKKSGERNSTSTVAEEISSLPHANEQVSQETFEPTDESINVLNEQLLAADHLVKQHVKVAEEAVAGWEKSKAESLSLKRRLDQLMEQKQASDDQISLMDGALKETTWKLRQIQEEQEQTIHDAVVNKTREWENLRLELQQRLEDADHQLVEAEFQNSLLFKRTQEQAEALLQLDQARSSAEAKLQMLQVRLKTFETENTSLKYEVTVLNNELAICNQDRDISKRALDAACRQKAESARRISRLEIECQKLRALVRKKLPGPGTLVQMKMEAERLSEERGKWRQGSTAVALMRSVESMESLDGTVCKQFLAMEEETKLLKEVLAERNNELQTARVASAQMAEKLSNLELQQAGQAQKSTKEALLRYGIHGVDSCISLSSCKEPSHAPRSEDGADDEHSVADSWASALISELASFSKDRLTDLQQPRKTPQSNKVCDYLDSIDDFIELERLISLPSEQTALVADREGQKSTVCMEETEIHMSMADLKGKLVQVEDQLSTLTSKNAANELNLFGLQRKLDMILRNVGDGDEARALEDVRSAVVESQCSSVDRFQAMVKKLSKASSSDVASEAPCLGVQRSSPCISDEKSVTSNSELSGAINEVIGLIEELANEIKVQQKNTHWEDCLSGSCAQSSRTQGRSELDLKMNKLKSSAKHEMQGNLELVEVMKELYSVLKEIRMRIQPDCLNLLNTERHRPEALKASEQEVFSEQGSPFSNMSNCDGCVLLEGNPAGHRLRGPQADEEVRKLLAEKTALESRMKSELSRVVKVEEMLVQVQKEKSQLKSLLEEEKEKLDTMKSRALDDEHLIATLRIRLASTEHSKNVALENLGTATSENSNLVSQLQECQAECRKWHEKVRSMERSVDEKQIKNDELQAKVEELRALLKTANEEKSNIGIALSAEKALSAEMKMKEDGIQSATEKLADCQRTIFILGKQIESMASARKASISCHDCQETAFAKQNSFKNAQNSNSAAASRRKQSIRYDQDHFSMLDLSDEELVSAAEGAGKAAQNPTSHEGYIEAVSQQLPSSPESDAITLIVPYNPPKTAPGKGSAAASVDLEKSQILSSSSSSPKRGNSFSRFFTRNKRGSS